MAGIGGMLYLGNKMNQENWSVFIRKSLLLNQEQIKQVFAMNLPEPEKKAAFIELWINKNENSNTLEKFHKLYDEHYGNDDSTTAKTSTATSAPRHEKPRSPISISGCNINAIHAGPGDLVSSSTYSRGSDGATAKKYNRSEIEKSSRCETDSANGTEVDPTADATEEKKQPSPPSHPQISCPEYPIDEEHKGRILIISNFEDELEGYKQDVKALKKMWTDFDCVVEGPKKNLTKKKLKEAIDEFSTKTTEYSFCAVFVLSHGGRGDSVKCERETLEDDCEFVNVVDILKPFSNVKNPPLQEKPKLFFFQICRGGEVHEGTPAAGDTGISAVPMKLPAVSDTLVCFPSQTDKKAYVPVGGSWFIQSLVKVFREYAKREHVVDMMTMVNAEIAKLEVETPRYPVDKGAKIMSEFRSTLRKNLYLYESIDDN